MLLRDDEEIVLNEIHALCIQVADHYEMAASKACASDIKNELLESARRHHEFAAQIAVYIRQRDDQPRLPDPDKETVGSFISNVKLSLAKNERQTLLEDQIKLEQKLVEATEEGLKMNYSTNLKELLNNIIDYVRAIQRSLALLA